MATLTLAPPKIGEHTLSLREQWAARAIRQNLAEIEQEAPNVDTNEADMHHLLSAKGSVYGGKDEQKKLRVGIVGAGAAGLFTAMIFDHLRERFGLDVEYEILEAGESVGGRLFSYYFKDEKPDPRKASVSAPPKQPAFGPHDYYDVGAMRFPKIKVMSRELGMNEFPDPARDNPPPKGALIPYYLSGPNQPALYNGIQKVALDYTKQWTANDFKIPDLPLNIMHEGAGKLVEDTIKSYVELYAKSPEDFWKQLMKEADLYTVREWLTQKGGFDYNTIEFLETMNYGNRWYDQALSEMILETIDFDPKAHWFCVEGGSQQLAYRMHEKIKGKVEFRKKVTAMSYKDPYTINVTVDGSERVYDAVFNSVPLGAMQHMQLEGLKLNWGTKQAIRSLGYGASCKVGIRFKTPWWRGEDYRIQFGSAKTDLPIRSCVYPSYNYYDKATEPAVLLASYTWSQEAQRIAALIGRDSPHGEEALKDVLIHDLARLHTKDDEAYQKLHKEISDSYLTHYAHDWYANPRMAGAFAYFGPQQFSNMYKFIIRNDGKHIIIGEGASAHHAWVVGALESATRGVYQFVHRMSKVNKAAAAAAAAFEKLPSDEGAIRAPFGPLPAEFSRTSDMLPPQDVPQEGKLDNKAPAMGDMLRLGVTFEKIRMKQGGDLVDPKNITKEQVSNLVAVEAINA